MTDQRNSQELARLIETMAALRTPSGCPWDREQTAESLKPYILEEAYEVVEAIDSGDISDICSELGDLLLQVVFIAQIHAEAGQFTFADVANTITEKLIRRHPHVFADADAADHARRWEEIKQQERQERGKGDKLRDKIPKNLPALKKAAKVAKKIHQPSLEQLVEQLHDTTALLTEKIGTTQTQKPEAELGDIFFTLVQLTRKLHLDAEEILRKKTLQLMDENDAN